MQPSIPGQLMAAEIAQQPEVLANQITAAHGHILKVARRIRELDPRFVVLAARGTSDHAALFAKYLIEIALGLPCGLASPSTLTGYHARPALDRVLWASVSQSGASPDLVESTETAASRGALTLAVTNDSGSPLATASDLHVDVHAGPELSVAATKSYTAQLQALWLLVDAWAADGQAAGVTDLPPAIRQVLDDPDLDGLAARYSCVDRIVAVGRGFSYPTARESALKLMETSYLSANAFSGADLLHGPLAMIDEDRPVVVFAPYGVGADLLRPVLGRLRDRGAHVCLVGADDLAAEYRVATHVPTPNVRESLSPIVQIVPMQLLAHHLAVARHRDPDQPRGLSKVTETR